jgi:hypothetical protein
MKIGMIALTAALLMLAAPAWAGPADPCAAAPGDADSDTVCDALDSCTLIPNAGGCDTDSDGYGNRCDGDFDNDGTAGGTDFTAFFSPDFVSTTDSGVGTDMDCDGVVGGTDFTAYFIPQFVKATPGPSGLNP